jgi:hypothetical protein
MNKKEITEHLKQLKDQEQLVNAILTLEKNSINEISYHSGTWNDHEFTCVSSTNWRSAEAVVEISVEEMIELLDNKDLIEINWQDFENVSLGEASSSDVTVSEIEWLDEAPTDEEMAENEFNDMELYWNSDITECECQFESGSVLSISFTINDFKYIIK